MNWRAWIFQVLSTAPEVTNEVAAANIYSGGSLTDPPDVTPFLVVTFMPSQPAMPGAKVLRAQVWAHDRGGSYVRIDRVLDAVRKALEEAGAQGGFISAVWEGDSNDLNDDAMNTNTRYAMFRIAARRDA